MKKKSSYSVIDSEGNIRKEEFPQRKKKDLKAEDFVTAEVGFYLSTPIIIGVILGIALDGWLHTKPLFTVGMIIAGMLASFYNLFKLFKRENARNKH